MHLSFYVCTKIFEGQVLYKEYTIVISSSTCKMDRYFHTNITMKVLILFCFLVVVFSQEPTPCETRPKQWEANLLRANRGGLQPHLISQRAHLTYDEINRRVREVDEFSFTPQKEILFEVISLYNVGKEYRINLKTRNCTVSTLTRPFRAYGIPDNSTFEGYLTIGAAGIPGEYMNLQHWTFMDVGNTFYGTVTVPDCFPVDYTEIVPPSTHRTTVFFNTKIGIRDPTVFTPPSECQNQ